MNQDLSKLLLEIETPSSITKYFTFGDDALYLEGIQKTDRPTRIVDTFANFWSLAYTQDLPEGKLFFKRHGRMIPVFGNVGLFAPPYSILDWNLQEGDIAWKSILIFSPPPVLTPKLATLFPLQYEIPFTRNGINWGVFELLKNGQVVDKEEKVLPLSLKAKEAIGLRFNDMVSLGEIAKDLGYSQSAMSRAFKTTYEISPVYYRNQLRVFDASIKLLKGDTVTHAGHEVGFHDLSRFNKQFKSRMKAVPRQFKTVRPG